MPHSGEELSALSLCSWELLPYPGAMAHTAAARTLCGPLPSWPCPSVSTALLLSVPHHLLYETGLQLEQNFSNIYCSQKDKQVDRPGPQPPSPLRAAWGPKGTSNPRKLNHTGGRKGQEVNLAGEAGGGEGCS